MKTTEMYTRFRRLSALGVSALAISMSGVAIAQDDASQEPPARPMFARFANPQPITGVAPAASMPTWNGSFTYQGTTYNYQMIGADPSTNSTTVIPVVIIPVKIVIGGRRGGGATFDPQSIPSNTGGLTVIQNTVQSPIFDSTTTFTSGGVNVGTTQYIDAFQRANFWGTVSSNPNYHVILSPTVLPEVTLSPSARNGKTGAPFGETVAEVNINWIDGQFHTLLTSLGITPNQFPIFLTYKTYLTSGGCCIGGYHSATGAQSYAEFTYIDQPGLFSQDVSALSHEVGEWLDDPLLASTSGNQTPCGILETGDPLEGETNYGGYPYVLHGFTFNLQDLVTLPYFGAPTSTTVNGEFTFQGQHLTVCSNGS